jgi:hypothetical protein
MLVYTPFALCFVTLWHFYAFSGTNLLTRCHSVSSLFSAVFVFQKSNTENILRIGQNKSQTLLFFPKRHDVRRWDGGEPGARLTLGRRGPAPGRATRGWDRLVHPLTPPFAYIFPSTEKPKGHIAFPRNILQAAAIIIARSGGSGSSSRHPTGEGNSCRRPSPPPWLPPEWCVNSLS